MSVIGYDKTEVVAMLAATWSHGSIGSLDAIRRFEYLGEFGTKLMKANSAAYAHTYNESPMDAATREAFQEHFTITGPEIKRACVCQTIENKLRGLRCLGGMRYNLIANDGTDFADMELLDGLLDLMASQMRRAA